MIRGKVVTRTQDLNNIWPKVLLGIEGINRVEDGVSSLTYSISEVPVTLGTSYLIVQATLPSTQDYESLYGSLLLAQDIQSYVFAFPETPPPTTTTQAPTTTGTPTTTDAPTTTGTPTTTAAPSGFHWNTTAGTDMNNFGYNSAFGIFPDSGLSELYRNDVTHGG